MAKNKNNLNKLIQNQKDLHNQEVNQIIDDTYNGDDYHLRLNEYNQAKKMKWWHWLISLAIAVVITGLSFLIGFLTKDSEKMPDYQAAGWVSLILGVLIIVAMMIVVWLKDFNASKFFKDKRRRYQKTLTVEEAKLVLANKIMMFALFLTLPTIIATNIVFN